MHVIAVAAILIHRMILLIVTFISGLGIRGSSRGRTSIFIFSSFFEDKALAGLLTAYIGGETEASAGYLYQ
jgi:hypothetical protein